MLQQLSINHRHRDFRTRAAGLLMLASKVRPAEVAAKLGATDQSIYNWARAWREQGVVGLLVGHKGGRPRALPDEIGRRRRSVCAGRIFDAGANRPTAGSRVQ
ncbi:helix-turn-helix domain-containing protein [Burkholderia ubonensis]|uniref:helix-turn-helix domain-containing protein n=1 Tax=Burkholderia ubonensis TaxID=101571 RepID=UPI0039F626EF